MEPARLITCAPHHFDCAPERATPDVDRAHTFPRRRPSGMRATDGPLLSRGPWTARGVPAAAPQSPRQLRRAAIRPPRRVRHKLNSLSFSLPSLNLSSVSPLLLLSLTYK